MTLEERKRQLELRLEDGDRKIDEAILDGKDVKSWEDFWLNLLAEYEDVCDQINTGK